jgi:hypothetical protein
MSLSGQNGDMSRLVLPLEISSAISFPLIGPYKKYKKDLRVYSIF